MNPECDPHCEGPPKRGDSYIGKANRAWVRLVKGWLCEQCEGCGLYAVWVKPESPRDLAALAYAEGQAALPDDWEREAEYHGRERFEQIEAFRAGWDAARSNAEEGSS